MSNPNKAIVLSSGGVDSTTAMAIARHEGYDVYSLSFQYGQRHACELEAAQRVAKAFGAKEHLVIDIDFAKIGGSALTDDIAVPKGRTEQEIEKEIPVTYVPARNTIFLSYDAIDYSGYPDCRPEYIEAFERMANLATKMAVEGQALTRMRTPLIQMTKAEIIQKGIELGVDYALTHSCYDPSSEGKACGECDSCLLRKKGFKEAGIEDPIHYET